MVVTPPRLQSSADHEGMNHEAMNHDAAPKAGAMDHKG